MRVMSAQAVFFWLVNLVCDTTGQLAFKAATNAAERSARGPHWMRLARTPYLWLGVTGFVLEFVFWLSFLSMVPLAMALFVGSGNVVLVMLGGRMLFGEKITAVRACAISLIAVGVAMVGWGRM
jgi:drug/metabolite transporter (DMT)-like permease